MTENPIVIYPTGGWHVAISGLLSPKLDKLSLTREAAEELRDTLSERLGRVSPNPAAPQYRAGDLVRVNDSPRTSPWEVAIKFSEPRKVIAVLDCRGKGAQYPVWYVLSKSKSNEVSAVPIENVVMYEGEV